MRPQNKTLELLTVREVFTRKHNWAFLGSSFVHLLLLFPFLLPDSVGNLFAMLVLEILVSHVQTARGTGLAGCFRSSGANRALQPITIAANILGKKVVEDFLVLVLV